MRLVFNPFTGTLDFVGTGEPGVPSTYYILTEGSDNLVSEAGDKLVTEEA